MAFESILGDVGSLANPFGPTATDKWNLSRGIYTPSIGGEIVFFYETTKDEDKTQKTAIDQIASSGGRRVVIYEYPYIDGQKTDDLGRKGETFNFNIKFWGTNHIQKLSDFIDTVVNDPGPGTLLHPTLSPIRGSIPVRCQNYDIIHRYDEFNAVTIRVTFVEDNTGEIETNFIYKTSQDSLLRRGLQTMTNVQSLITQVMFQVGALLNLPNAIINGFKQRLDSIIGAYSRLHGQLAATFAQFSKSTKLAAQSANITGGIPSLTSGTVNISSTQSQYSSQSILGQLPPVYQVGFDPVTLDAIAAQINNFINASQITPQQAVFACNQIRDSISTEIKSLEEIYGNDGYSMTLEYRTLANVLQETVEACIASTQAQVIVYTLPSNMSLRMVAKKNNLTPDRQNDIENLNPYLPSVNFIPKGSKILVPAA